MIGDNKVNMPKKKMQHYVPKFYFKLFSIDGNTINLFDKNQKKFRSKIPYKTLCRESYFYGRDTEIEKSFEGIEMLQVETIKKLINEKDISSLDENKYFHLLLFLLFQYSRTKIEKEKAKNFTDKYIKEIIKRKIKYDKKLLDKIKIVSRRDHILKIYYYITAAPLISDLKPVLLLNESKENFIFSDAPVIFHNTYFDYLEGGTRGMQCRGLQIFCPLNSKLMIMLFDEDIYNIKNQDHVVITSPKDAKGINSLQLFYSDRYIYFSDEEQLKSIGDLYVKLSPHVTDYAKKELICGNGALYEPNIKFNLNLSFVNFKGKNIKFGIRNPKNIDTYEKLLKKFSESLLQPNNRKN